MVVGNKTDLLSTSVGHAVPEEAALDFIHRWGPSSSLATPEDEGDRTLRHVFSLVSSGPNVEVVAHDNETLVSDAVGPVDISR